MAAEAGGNKVPEHPRGPARTARPILAVSSNGRITKANLQARRAFGDVPLEGEQLGTAIARSMFSGASAIERIAVNLLSSRSEGQEVLLVPSDLDAAPASTAPEAEREYSVRVEPHSSAQVSDFIAHELRNHLATVLGLAQFLETDAGSLSLGERMASLRRIQAEADDALLVLEGLLKLVESRRSPELASANVPLHSVIHRVIVEHRRRFPERPVVVGGDEPVYALGNSTWMQIAIRNLVANAEKVTPPGEPIQVNLYQEANRALVLVLDKGQPLATPMYQELWDIYSKGPPSGLKVSGTGIGLSICKELVSAMGGRVWAGPRRDLGSAFAISLQIAPSSGASAVA